MKNKFGKMILGISNSSESSFVLQYNASNISITELNRRDYPRMRYIGVPYYKEFGLPVKLIVDPAEHHLIILWSENSLQFISKGIESTWIKHFSFSLAKKVVLHGNRIFIQSQFNSLLSIDPSRGQVQWCRKLFQNQINNFFVYDNSLVLFLESSSFRATRIGMEKAEKIDTQEYQNIANSQIRSVMELSGNPLLPNLL